MKGSLILTTRRYYGVDSQVVNWTSLVYMVAYIPLIFPGTWLMDKAVRDLSASVGFFTDKYFFRV